MSWGISNVTGGNEFGGSGGQIIPGVDASSIGYNPNGINAGNTLQLAGTVAGAVYGGPLGIANAANYVGNQTSRATGGSGSALQDVGVSPGVATGMNDLLGLATLASGADAAYTSYNADYGAAQQVGTGYAAQDPGAVVTADYGFQPPGSYQDMGSGQGTYDTNGNWIPASSTPAAPGSMAGMSQGVGAAAPQGMSTLGQIGMGTMVATNLYGLYKSAHQDNSAANTGVNTAAPGLTTAANTASTASTAASTALTTALNDPSSYYNSDSYKAGLSALERTDAAQGYSGSGKMMADLQNYGTSSYQSYLTNLASIAGTTLNSASGAVGSLTSGASQQTNQNSQTLQSEINALNQLGITAMQYGR